MNYKKQQKNSKKKRRVCENFECICSSEWNAGDPEFIHEENCSSCWRRKCKYFGNDSRRNS